MKNRVQVKGSIILKAKIDKTYHFLSNLENDRLWRKEINITTMNGPVALGVRAIESTYFSRRNPEHILQLECTHIEPNKEIRYTTVTESAYFLQSIRKVKSLSETHTQFDYEVSFDKSLVKAGIGFSLPRFIIQLGAERDMKNYLKKLKKVLE